MKKGRLLTLIAFVILVLIGAAYTLSYLYQKEQAPQARFNLETPRIGDIVLKTVSSGTIGPRKEIAIKPQISGIVDALYVEAGETVTAGQPLARVRVVPDMAQLASAQSRVERGRIALENTKSQFQRQENLLKSGVISTQDFQGTETTYLQAQEEMLAAEDNLLIVQKGAANRAGETTNTLISSTVEGMVLDVPVEVGNQVIQANTFNEGTTISSVADMSDLIFRGQIDESEIENLHVGIPLILSIGAMPGRKFDATLEYIAPKGMPENGAVQFEIRAAVALAEGDFIRAGFSANADVVLDQRNDVLSLSESLIQFDGSGPYVEVQVSPQQFERRELTLGLSDGLVVEILSGVVITDSIKRWNQPIFE
jgi:HlyD family secretion protein